MPDSPDKPDRPMKSPPPPDAAAVSFMVTDILEQVLLRANRPYEMGDYLTLQLRELVGARVVALLQGPESRLVSVAPERYRDWEHGPLLGPLCGAVLDADRTMLWDGSSTPEEARPLLERMQFSTAILVPLVTAQERVGTLVLLELLHMDRPPEMVRTLDLLGPVVALLLRHALLFEAQEATIESRTRQLAESRQQFRSLAQVAPVGIAQIDANGRFVFTNERFQHFTGFTGEGGPAELLRRVPEDDHGRVEEAWRDLLASQMPMRLEHVVEHPPGECRWLRVVGEAVPDDADLVTRYIVVLDDITARKKAELERDRLEARLAQGQKLEAVGRLAGGVAHDFNNMLTVIMGHSNLLRLTLAEGDPRLQHVDELEKAAFHARNTTQQLLAFSRKQMIAPRPVDLNGLVEDARRALVRLIGEDIELIFHRGVVPFLISIDPSQLEQILVNLAINARDAMPGGGTLTMETSTVTVREEDCEEGSESAAGSYACLVFRDTGTGMDAVTLAHLFEPFFTTKAVGHGTGLGLSTVYGIVKQNGGFIKVESEPGKGSLFAIHLPRAATTAAPPVPSTAPPEPPSQQAPSLSVLVVEDDEMVRELVTAGLRRLGHHVVSVTSPARALERTDLEAFDLLLTDVVMPEMSGRELRDRLLRRYPHLRVLFMSGYSAEVVSGAGDLDSATPLLQKPFGVAELGRKVTEVMQ